MDRVMLKNNAKNQLSGRWGLAIGVTLVATILTNISYGANGLSFFGYDGFGAEVNIVSLLLGGAFAAGLCRFMLNMATNINPARFEDLFEYFKVFLKTVGLNLIITIATAIGLALFIVPGVIVALMFSQCYYILAEDSSKSITECINESIRLMNGHKLDLLVLQLSFLGWLILIPVTCGIASLWVMPYMKLTEANFYLSIKY